jgi:glucuronide carrier protein
LLLISVAVFSIPTGIHGTSAAVVWAYITSALLGLLYSLVNIPHGSLAAAMTQVPTERAKLATWRIYGSNLTILMLAFVVSPQIKSSGNLQHSLTITTLVFVVVGAALYLLTFLTAREQVQRDVAQVSLRQFRDGEDQPSTDHAVRLRPAVPHWNDRGEHRRCLLRPQCPR